MRKFLITAATAASLALPSFAGGLAPTVTPDVVVPADKPASSVSPLLIIGLLVLVGVLVSQNNDNNN